ncbi:alpha-galactosidase [Tessaracoccus terricola]
MPSIDAPAPGIFHLTTSTASVVLGVGPAAHLELWWFGDPLQGAEADQLQALRRRFRSVGGVTVNHGRTRDSELALNRQPLAFSTHGKGDFRQPALGIRGRRSLDLTYRDHRIHDGTLPADGLPGADAEPGSQTLELTLTDDVVGVAARVRWTTFPLSGVLTHRVEYRNTSDAPLVLDRAASVLLDLPDRGFDVVTLDGWWAAEALPTRTPLGHTRITNASGTGSSSTEHNPGTLLLERGATETSGCGYGFNLLWSGSHATTFEGGRGDVVRVVSGTNPDGFGWELAPGEAFTTPEAVLAYSNEGIGGISRAMHRFVDTCIVPAHWRGRPRPVVLNNWEGTYFDFDTPNLLEIAERAAGLGVETFVLDDGWFGRRDDDTSSLGDWVVNTDKLDGGLAAVADGVTALGMGFGLWFEPECVNEDSDLFRAHPDWAVRQEGRAPSEGRHQLLLDLTRPEVRDHIVAAVGAVLDQYPISFVKWDMNRLVSDASADGFHHRYVLGLYDVLGRIFGPRPDVLLENCSSGGNRFDLGLLTFGPQVWASDCTDPAERLAIQHGLGLLYPPSTISAHVSASPNHQTGRETSMDFRFAVSAPYVFGAELDPSTLDDEESERLAAGIAWYKQHRELLQFGEHHRGQGREGRHQLSVMTDGRAISFEYNARMRPGTEGPSWRVPGLLRRGPGAPRACSRR